MTTTRKPRKKKVKESLGNWCQDYNEVSYEIETHKRNLKLLTNLDLIDSVTHAIDLYNAKDIDVIYSKIHNNKEISSAERSKLEGFYILINGEFTCQE